MIQCDHILLTRFNLPSKGYESYIRAAPEWLEHRVKLFNKYCLPSILAQTSKSFRWLIYFDPASPAWLLDLIKEHQAKGYYVAKFREEVPREILMADMAGLFPDRHAILLTTSLDNDDALAIDFVARLQSSLQTHGAFVYFFENGVIKSPKGVFERYDPNNAFPSVSDRWENGLTAWSDWHTRLAGLASPVRIGGAPGWLQVIHDRNVSNRVRGRLARIAPARALFPGMLDDVAPPSFLEIFLDRTIGHPLRETRDRIVVVAKAVLFRLGGKQYIDRARRLIRFARRKAM
ncbi:glycosyltransferase [Aerococcus urinae]|uniref:glycosyltransferase n=1 Tax=Aerococcus urinae TaxID=1376 RepID=UPI000DCB4F47|nr:hypothetical protein DBT41_11760 [Aerococcus urinae]